MASVSLDKPDEASGRGLVTPRGLKKGDTIALLSPSARLNKIFPLRVARGKAFLEAQGFIVEEIYADIPRDSLVSSARARAAELERVFTDPKIKAIICTIGGDSCNELLPYLDCSKFQPKIFMGSSDITLLHHALRVDANLRTFYGPSIITSLGEYPRPLDFTWSHFQHVLLSQSPSQPGVGPLPGSQEWTSEFLDWTLEASKTANSTMRSRQMKLTRGWRWLREGKAQGELWGGCMPSILQTMGTRWDVSYKGKILLLETPEGDYPNTGMPVARAVYHLNDLTLRGVWQDIVGLVVGRPYLSPDEEHMEPDWEREVLRATEGYNFPILAGVDVGHTDPMLTIPLGAMASLDSEKGEWAILEPGVTARDD